ncbi:vanadium-dependent haloperoxidase [Pokkaliibacter sp. MBI-7]|uniref:vanadium-dependent haloperoxidase n=1 Tax=Pokkaliibacter sp. MBI-7 TaxID=3040600 RepID=UPI00244C757F|nr:vanadium-dependent haloperoxidase [Pokkaliibacter sp. MBI-7]MDH2434631.1 vanadium-dependent haloperoxidase [Pokkaliibacter sp. MBI-7]
MQKTPVPVSTVTNGDDLLVFDGARFLGNFHKTLPHNEKGEVDAQSYIAFEKICDQHGDFELTPASAPVTNLNLPPPANGTPSQLTAAQLVNPQAGRATNIIGPNPIDLQMLPAPSVLSYSTAAEMVELYWMAKLRDTDLNDFALPTAPGHQCVNNACNNIKQAYQKALDAEGRTTGDLRLGLDLPQNNGQLHIEPETLFRCGLKGEDKGPLISQFLLHDINYGAQLIQQTLVPYKARRDYLITFDEWLAVQKTGKDKFNNDYGKDNNYTSGIQAATRELYYEPQRRRIQTLRDLARLVNRDALHQTYFNAALLLDSWGADTDPHNPYNALHRQIGFGTLGGPNLLALVSEVATRALKVVWRQKWLHRRLRPEVYGGLLHVQARKGRNYGLPLETFEGFFPATLWNKTGRRFVDQYLLPMAFSAGSPCHPSYGAGHASVAGACVTILKAWFDEGQPITQLKAFANPASKDPSPYFSGTFTAPHAAEIVVAGQMHPGQAGFDPDTQLRIYTGNDKGAMTVGGELNKLASNVAMGRSMGGVHWRSDNTRSLRLGEQVATVMLSRLMPTYTEKPTLSYTNFDGNAVSIGPDGHVKVVNDPELEALYQRLHLLS